MDNSLKDKQKTKYYEEKISINIEKMNTIEKKIYIYKTMEDYLQSYTISIFKNTDIFLEDFI